jgi:hypothetical protein
MADVSGLLLRLVKRGLAVLGGNPRFVIHIASATTSSVESPAILARSDSSLGDDVAILALGSSLGSYIANVSSAWGSRLLVNV